MTRDALPPLNAVRAFDAVCRHGSVSASARAQHVSQSAISRHITHLEQALGCRLFDRHPGGMTLTEAGRELQACTGPALQDLRECARRLRARSAGVRVLRVVSLSSFALRWLTPRLPRFQRASAGVALDLRIGDGQPVFERGELDCAIVSEAPADRSATAIDLFAERLAAVCSPSFDADAAELRGPLIHVSSRPDLWSEWAAADADLPLDPTQAGLSFQDFYIAVGAALAGAGLALVPDYLVGDELACGALIEPLGRRQPTGRRYRLLIAPGRDRDAAVKVFSAWLQQEIERDAGVHG